MPKFRFKLETVLQVRKSRQEEALIALGAAQRAYQQAQFHKMDLQRQLQDSLLRRESLASQATSVMVFRTEQDFINGTKQRIIQSDQAIMRASRVVEKALRGYLTARKQTRMIEVLEEKARKEFRLEQAKKEQKQLDELIVMRARLRTDSDDGGMNQNEPLWGTAMKAGGI